MGDKPDSDGGVLRNLRVIDQEAAESLAARLQAMLERCDAAGRALNETIARAESVSGAAEKLLTPVERQLKLAARALKLLQDATDVGEALGARIKESGATIENRTSRIGDIAAEGESKLTKLAADAQARIGEALAQLEQRRQLIEQAAARAESMNAAVERTETRLAVECLRSAMTGGWPGPPAQPPVPMPAAMPGATGQGPAAGESAQARPSGAAAATMLAIVSAELRPALSEIAAATVALRGAAPSAEQLRQLEQAEGALAEITDIVSSIERLTERVHSRGPEGEFDLRQAVETVAGRLTRRAKDRGAALVCTIDDGVPSMVRGDGGRVRQILLYMANNAIKCTTGGEILVHAMVESNDHERTVVRVVVESAGAPQSAPPPGGSETGSSMDIAAQLAQKLGGTFGSRVDEAGKRSLWFSAPWERCMPHGASRRQHNRLAVEGVESSLGSVVEMSLGGARVIADSELEGPVEFRIDHPEFPIDLKAEVVWSRRQARKRFEVGIRFLEVPADVGERLTRLCMQHRKRTTLAA